MEKIQTVGCDFLKDYWYCELFDAPCFNDELTDSFCIHSNSWEMTEEDDARFDGT